MSNPYYIPRDNTRFQNILALASLATQLYGLKQRGDIAEEEVGIGQEKNRLTAENIRQQGTIAGQTNAVNVEQNRIRGEEARLKGEEIQVNRAKIPYHQQNFGYGDQAVLRIQLGKLGIKDDSLLVQRAKELADNRDVTKLDAYQSYHDDPEMQQAAIDSLQKKMESRVAKEPNYLESREGKQDYEALQQISTEEGWHKAIDAAFKNTVQSAKQAEMSSKAAQIAATAELAKNRYIQTDQGLFDTQTQSVVGGTGKLVAPEKPSVVGPGASLVPPGANRPSYTNPNRATPEPAPTIVPPGASVLPRGATTPSYIAPEAAPKPAETRATSKEVADAETLIGANSTKEAVAGKVDFFNQYANKDYVYQWKKGKLYGGEWEKVKLPEIQGRQVTAKDVYDTAAQRGMTYEAVLRAIGALK